MRIRLSGGADRLLLGGVEVNSRAYVSRFGFGGADAGAAGGGQPGGKEEVLDAEFEEVKDKDGKGN